MACLECVYRKVEEADLLWGVWVEQHDVLGPRPLQHVRQQPSHRDHRHLIKMSALNTNFTELLKTVIGGVAGRTCVAGRPPPPFIFGEGFPATATT